MENAAFTFEQLLYRAVQDNPGGAGDAGPAIQKAKLRVLKVRRSQPYIFHYLVWGGENICNIW